MKLCHAILNNVLKENKEEADVEKLFEKECYKVLENIKNILEDDSLNDNECFEKIEQIVCQFEIIGSSCGTRHDFG